MAYEIDYNDERFQEVEADKTAAINEVDKTYGDMIAQSDSYYQAQIDAAKDWEQKQTDLQNQQTDFAIQEIEQQKEQAKKDYTKEQSGAYVDWQKQSNEYGANAEAEAMQGMQNTGFSESSQVSMYNTYQNRVASARESYNQAVQNYNNAITEARLQNNSALAEIAYQALQQQLELSLAGFQYKNQLILSQVEQKNAVENQYYARYQDVLSQINTENALAEQVRQYNEQMAEEQRQYNEQMALEREQWEWQQAQAAAKSSGSSGGGGGSGGSGGSINKTTASANNAVLQAAQQTVNGLASVAGSLSGSNTGTQSAGATDYLNAMVASGASKSDVTKEINEAVKQGALTDKEAAELKKTYTSKGYTY